LFLTAIYVNTIASQITVINEEINRNYIYLENNDNLPQIICRIDVRCAAHLR